MNLARMAINCCCRLKARVEALELIGTGDVSGPAIAVNDDVVFFDGVTGKLIKDGGVTKASLSSASSLTSGTLPDARLSANVTQLGTSIDLSGAEATGILAGARAPALTGAITSISGTLITFLGSFTKANLNTAINDGDAVFVGDALGTPSSGNGSNLTALNATQLTSGTVPVARLSATMAELDVIVSDGNVVYQGQALGTPSSGNGSNLTALNATQLTTGTVPVGRLSFTEAELNTMVSNGDVMFMDTGIPQNSQSAAYTTVLADAQKHLLHPAADTTARTFTIDSNANVAYPIGTAITFVNENAAGVLTIAITSDTMRLAGAGTTGSRSLAANGIATALKITSTSWIISGTGLT